jgi:hypothetical protein
MFRLPWRRETTSEGSGQKLEQLEEALDAYGALLDSAEEQLLLAHELLEKERSRNDELSTTVQRVHSPRIVSDAQGWGIEPGVGL